jgi:hypothetical protein
MSVNNAINNWMYGKRSAKKLCGYAHIASNLLSEGKSAGALV